MKANNRLKHSGLIVGLLFFPWQRVFAQDIIVKRDGTTIMSKVVEVGTSEVKYKKWSNKNGPIYIIGKSELMAINYENGEKDSFATAEAAPAKQALNGNRNYHPAPDLTTDVIRQKVEQKRPYVLFQKGAAAIYIMEVNGTREKWDAGPSYIKQYVSDVRIENGVLVAYTQLDYLNKKGKPSSDITKSARNRLFKVEIDPEGNYHFVHNWVHDAFIDIKSRKGFGMLVEGNMEADKMLTCGKMVETTANRFGAVRQNTIEYSDWKVVGEGKLTTPAGTFDCVKLTGYITEYNEKSRVTCWMARGIGIVRYDVGTGKVKYILNSIESIQ